jgi:predicted AAA+ superfamily ATPase
MQPYVPRRIPLADDLRRGSVLLLGPRRTGKSALIRHEFGDAQAWNLLRSDTFAQLSARPSIIREGLAATRPALVVIDEIQKLPGLMDEVHLMIEEFGQRFLLTGSSARKLRRTHTSLMAGRARTRRLFPFVSAEVPISDESLARVLSFGLLPPIYFSDDPSGDLRSYVGDYLKEEIQAEALARKIENFSRFLARAAAANAQLLNFESIASDAQVPARSVREYFALLEDTLVGRLLHPLAEGGQRKVISKGKFYFFDIGVVHALQGVSGVGPLSPGWGDAFESWIFHELSAWNAYTGADLPLQFWRTTAGVEVDFVIDGRVAIEVKATTLADERDTRGLRALADDRRLSRQVLVTRDAHPRRLGSVEVLPYAVFLQELWGGTLV